MCTAYGKWTQTSPLVSLAWPVTPAPLQHEPQSTYAAKQRLLRSSPPHTPINQPAPASPPTLSIPGWTLGSGRQRVGERCAERTKPPGLGGSTALSQTRSRVIQLRAKLRRRLPGTVRRGSGGCAPMLDGWCVHGVWVREEAP
ncbi:hypothetical protein BC567DRAFT_56622 [Phyllosticta citribraziliensis]